MGDFLKSKEVFTLAKKREYDFNPTQFDQMMYVERIDALVDATEENNKLLQKLIDLQTPKEEAKSTKSTASKKTNTEDKKDEPEDKKGE